MKCEEFASALDAYIDGELSADEMRAIREHAAGCAACGTTLKEAEFLRDTLQNMDDDLFVPLEAQAAWRTAVKRERARKKKNTWVRSLTAVAAAAVVLVGSITLIEGQKKDLPAETAVPYTEMAAEGANQPQETMLLIASDGESESAKTPNEETDYACWKKIRVKDMDAACDALEQLAAEYEGSVTREKSTADSVTYRIELPGSNLDDFAAAVGGIGDVRDSESRDVDCDPVLAFVQLLI